METDNACIIYEYMDGRECDILSIHFVFLNTVKTFIFISLKLCYDKFMGEKNNYIHCRLLLHVDYQH